MNKVFNMLIMLSFVFLQNGMSQIKGSMPLENPNVCGRLDAKPVDSVEYYYLSRNGELKMKHFSLDYYWDSDTGSVLNLMVNAFQYHYGTQVWAIGAYLRPENTAHFSELMIGLYPHLRLQHSLPEIQVQIELNLMDFYKCNQEMLKASFKLIKNLIRADIEKGVWVEYDSPAFFELSYLCQRNDSVFHRIQLEIKSDTVLSNRLSPWIYTSDCK